jgi:hypothetical protein
MKAFRAAGIGSSGWKKGAHAFAGPARGTFTGAAFATRAAAGAAVGAIAGGAWGAVSDRESIVGGALKGAFVGGAIRAGSHQWIRSHPGGTIHKDARLMNSKNMLYNLRRSWKYMGLSQNRAMRNWMIAGVGVGTLRGMASGNDNPIGGAAGGAMAGAMQGAGVYGAWKGAQKMGLKFR